MRNLTLLLGALIFISLANAGVMILTATGTVNDSHGPYLTTRAKVGDPFVLTVYFDTETPRDVAANGNSPAYVFHFPYSASITVGPMTFRMHQFDGFALPAYTGEEGEMSGYTLVGSGAHQESTASIYLRLISTNPDLVGAQPSTWLTVATPQSFDSARTVRVAGSVVSTGATFEFSGQIETFSVRPVTVPSTALPAFIARPIVKYFAYAMKAFAAADSENPLTYQWQCSYDQGETWLAALGNDSSRGPWFTIWSAPDSRLFRVVATNSCGSVVSEPAVPLPDRGDADFNLDGKGDILWENTATGERGAWLMSGASFSSWTRLENAPRDWSIVATADFDQDGQTDLLWENTATGERLIWWMDGAYCKTFKTIGAVPPAWHIVAAGDFNADGHPDIIWENTATGERGVWLMSGPHYTSWISFGVVSTDWHVAAVANFNDDAQVDLLWENTVTGERGVWLMESGAFKNWLSLGSGDTEWKIVAARNLAGDRHPDIIWRNSNSGQLWLWVMSGTSFVNGVALGGAPLEWRAK